MVELLASGLTADNFSYEAEAQDNNDGGPAKGGELIIAISPQLMAGDGWADHSGKFLDKMSGLDGVRMPGARRHNNRNDDSPRQINSALIDTINALS